MENILELINNNNFEEILKIKDFDTLKIDDNNIFHLMAIRGNESGLDFFIKNKSFDINISNEFGYNIIHLLFKNGWDKLAEKYYKMFPELLYNLDNILYSPIFYCIDRFDSFLNCFNFIKKKNESNLLNILNDVSIKNNNIITLLINKSKNKEDDIYVKFLIENINFIEFKKPKISPVLIYCILNNKTLLAKYFINNNKGLHDKNNLYLLPINIACGKNNIDIVKMILDKDSDITYGGLDNDYLPLNIAIINDYIDLIELLIPYIKNYNLIDKYKNTYLHYLSDKLITYFEKENNKYEKKIKYLLRIFIKNGNIDYPNNDGLTPRRLLEQYLKLRKKNKLKNKDSDTKQLINSINSIEELNNNSIESEVDIIKSNKKYNSGLFNADVLHNMLYSIYLLQKYDNLAIPYQKYNEKKYNEDNHDLSMQNINYSPYYKIMYDIIKLGTFYLYPFIPSLILWKDKNLYYINNDLFKIIEKINKNRKKRFIMIKISLIVGEQFTHANMIVIDLEDKSVRRFEPYGISNVNDEKYLDELLEKKISNILNTDIKYYKPGDYLDITKFQSVSNDNIIDYKKSGDPGGYCLAWCFWYVELKLNNSQLSEKELILNSSKKIIKYYKKTNNPYLYFIRDYARKLNAEKDKILKKIKINPNDFYDINYKVSNLKKIFEYLIKYFE